MPCHALPYSNNACYGTGNLTQALREKIARLKEELNETEQKLEDTDSISGKVGRTPTHQNLVQPFQNATPSSPLGLTPRIPRPQDVAYQETLKGGQATENNKTMNEVEQLKVEAGVLKIFSQLAQALTDNNNSDVSTPPHFSGKDDEWETWYSQFRTYLKGK